MVPPEVRAALDALRRQTLERVQDLERDRSRIVDASRSSNADDEHDPEGSTLSGEWSQVDALRRATVSELADVEDALTRMEGGSYGVCIVCGRDIPRARLEARPMVRTCVGCAV